MPSTVEYLVGHGKSAALGRFGAETAAEYRRGDRVIVRSARGLEFGTVLCPVSERQGRLLGHTTAGQLLRRATEADDLLATENAVRARGIVEESRRLVRELALPVEILDAEVLIDADRVIVQCLAANDLPADGLIAKLEERHHLQVWLENLAVAPAESDEAAGGCGQPGCGHGSGGCTSCESGGCSSCGHSKVDMRDYFAHLRTRMEERQQRTPLL